jgi:hypothetical protein
MLERYPHNVEKSALKAHWADERSSSGPLTHTKGRGTARLERSTRIKPAVEAPYSSLLGTYQVNG